MFVTFLTYKEKIKQKVRLSYRRNDYVDDDAILSHLHDFILECNEVSSAPILDLLSALSCDLRGDFYPYFPKFFTIIKDIITKDQQDADVLNYAFNCLSHLVYFLHRYLTKDVNDFLKLFLPLLTHKKEFIRSFSAGCMAFVLRKIPASHLLLLLWQLNQEYEAVSCETGGALLAEILRSPDGCFHSSSIEIFPTIFAIIAGADVQEHIPASCLQAKIPRNGSQFENLSSIATSLEAAEFFKGCLVSSLKVLADSKMQPEALFTICKLAFSQFGKVCSSRVQILISCSGELVGLLQTMRFLHRYEAALEVLLLDAFARHPIVPLAELIITFVGLASSQFNSSRLMRKVLMASGFTDSQQISLMLSIIRHNSFERDFLQILADVLLGRDTTTPVDDSTLEYLARLVIVRQPPPLLTSDLSIVRPPSSTICLSLSSGCQSSDVLRVARWIIEPITDLHAEVKRKFYATLCLPHLSPVPVVDVLSQLMEAIEYSFDRMKQMQPEMFEFMDWAAYLLASYEAWYSFGGTTSVKSIHFIDEEYLLQTALAVKEKNVDLCTILLRILDMTSEVLGLSVASVEEFLPFLLSFSHQVRLHSLRIIRRQLAVLSSKDATSEDLSSVKTSVERCLSAETTKKTPGGLREFLLLVLHMHCGRSTIFGSPLAAKISLHHLLGLLHVNLTPAWDDLTAAVASYANPIFYSEAADSAVQPDVRRQKQSRSKVRARSRSPLVHETEGEETEESKSSEVFEQWRMQCRDLFWRVMVDLLKRPVTDVQSLTPCALVPKITIDSLSVMQAFTSLLTVVPDNDVGNVSDSSGGLAPVTFAPRRMEDWKNYRLNLWRCITPKGVGKYARTLMPLFLSFVSEEFYATPSQNNERILICALDLFSRMPNLHSVYKHQEFGVTLLRLLTNKRPSVQKAAFTCWMSFAPSGLRPYAEHFEKILNLRTFRDAVRVFKIDTSVVSEHRSAVSRVLIRILYGRLHLSKENFASAVFTNLAGCSEEELNLLLSLIVESFFSALAIQDSSNDLTFAEINARAKPNWSRLQAICHVVSQLLSYMGHRLGGIKPPSEDQTQADVTKASPHLPTIFKIAILMISTSSNKDKKQLQQGPHQPHSKQVKVVSRTGVSLLLHLFSAPGIDLDAFWTAERIACVQTEVLAKHRLTSSAVASPGHLTLKLALVWSQSGSEHLVSALFTPDLLNAIVQLLQHKNLSTPVARVIVEVMINLIFSQDIQELGRRLLRPFHGGLTEYLYNRFLTLRSLSSSQARKTLNSTESEWLQREFKLLAYLTVPPAMQNGSEETPSMLSSKQASRLLTGLVPFLVKALTRPPSQIGSGISLLSNAMRRGSKSKSSGMTDVAVQLPRPRPASEAAVVAKEIAEVEMLRVLCRLMEITADINLHFGKVLELFSIVDSRISRALLCSAAGVAAARIAQSLSTSMLPKQLLACLADVYVVKQNMASQMSANLFNALRTIRSQQVDPSSVSPGASFEKNVLYKLLCMLNSWSTSRLEMVDAVQRESALNALLGLCDLPLEKFASQDRLHYFIHLAGVHSALYTLQTSEIQLRDLALDYIFRLAEVLSDGIRSANDATKKAYQQLTKRLIIQSLWPGLVRNLKRATGPRRIHFLRLLTGLVKSFGSSHAFFAPLSLLADSTSSDQEPVCFYVNIQSGTSSRQLFAIRRLALFLSNPLTIASKKAITNCSTRSSGEDSFVIPLSHLRGVFLPILLFFLRQEMMAELSGAGSLGQESRQLVSACLNAVRALASRMAWPPYRELLSAALSNLDQESTIALRYTLAILDGYRPHEEAVDFMLAVVGRLQTYIIPPTHKTESQPKSFTYLRTNAIVALVTLLRRLPKGQLESRLPTLVLRVVDLLRPAKKLPSHARLEAVQALSKVAIMVGSGPALDSIFSTLARELSRGYMAMTIRLAALHRIFFDYTAAMDRGEVAVADNLDNVCHVLLRLYLDEVAGQLGEEIDSRREAFHKGSTTDATLGVTTIASSADLPEARGGLRAPDGLPALLRFCSPTMLERVFKELKTAAALIASGRIISNENLQQGGEQLDDVKSDDKLTGQLRFRKRCMARLQAVFDRIPTRHGIFHPKLSTCASTLMGIALSLMPSAAIKSEDQPQSTIKRGIAALYRPGWSISSTQPLEKRPDYLSIPPEPKLASQNPHATQTDQAHVNMLSACGLYTIIGLVRQGILLPTTRSEDAAILSDAIPALLSTLVTSKSLVVLAGAVRCTKLFLHLQLDRFEAVLPEVARSLFSLVDKHAGVLNSRITAKDSAAQSFAHGLYATLAALIQHQAKYTLSNAQLAILFSTIETEVTRDAPTSPALSLLYAFLTRRLRDPLANTDEDESRFVPLRSEEESSLSKNTDNIITGGLVVSKVTDNDFSFAGAGGGQRLSTLMLRLQRLAIMSSSETVRRDCRRCLLAFLLNYPHQRRFVMGFINFFLRQLEHARELGRASVATLLCTIVAELPQGSLLQDGLDETLLLAVGAAIEREVSVSVRLSLYGLIRLLFTRLPGKQATNHFQEYLLAFLRAPVESRASAKLLGLQTVAIVLDSQECLSIDTHRRTLIKILGKDIFAELRKQLIILRTTHPHLFRDVVSVSGCNEDNALLPPQPAAEEENKEDEGEWLNATDVDKDVEVAPLENRADEDDEDEVEDLGMEVVSNEVTSDVEEGKEEEAENLDVEIEPSKSEKASAEAVKVVESCIAVKTADEASELIIKPSKSAPDLHFSLVCCSLEQGLRLADRLLSDVDDSVITSSLCAPIWDALLKVERKKRSQREMKFATLLQTSKTDDEGEVVSHSLLLAPSLSVREWVSRLINRLLRAELDNTCNARGEVATPPKFESPFFTNSKNVCSRLIGILNDSLHQLEIDSLSGKMSEEYSNMLLSNLIYLGQFLNALNETKHVLKIFKTANRLSLDELNNRRSTFCQRIMALKLTVGLLLKLPRPSPAEIATLIAKRRSRQEEEGEDVEKTNNSRSNVGIVYLRSALRLLARESKQRDRLAFLATASIAMPGDVEPSEGAAISRRLAGRLGSLESARARSRRRRAQAKMRRALLSGELTAQEAAQRLANISVVEVSAADHLIELIESTHTRLTKELLNDVGGGKVAGGMSALYSWSTSALSRKREMCAARKAVCSAVGVAAGTPQNNSGGRTEESMAVDSSPPRKRTKIQ
ncbi:unnamed protein product [Hydatigera taeniaeformis]|uniref:DRIM domain-containing protein n=1 Tax=Hydatigena taeniaeformis TaxID=6205 RepID=A0A0R3X0H5_HYDTA|nr:unnamed protein product [Hydatigera taeniaeformis]